MRKIVLVILGLIIASIAVIVLKGVPDPSGDNANIPLDAAAPARIFRMGFSLVAPPLKNERDILKRLDMWAKRADSSIMHQDVPWKKLLTGVNAEGAANEEIADQIKLLRGKNLRIVMTIEPLNGMDRKSEAPQLIELGKSIKDPDVQKVYREYVLAAVKIANPDYLGLAAEVNQFKNYNSSETYQALVNMVNHAAADLKKNYPDPPLYVSVQAEEAWGGAGHWNEPKSYRGLDGYYSDFPFIDALGVSSYPQLTWKTPEEIPGDYFTQFKEGRLLPLLITESGWGSRFDPVPSSEDMQIRWIDRLEELADNAGAVFVSQILFSDFEDWIPRDGSAGFFASQGLVDNKLNAKPALAEWDKIYARRHFDDYKK